MKTFMSQPNTFRTHQDMKFYADDLSGGRRAEQRRP
ncbi:hypothetical protein BH10PSE5_BH10PSE5_30820 [soil metagenome]